MLCGLDVGVGVGVDGPLIGCFRGVEEGVGANAGCPELPSRLTHATKLSSQPFSQFMSQLPVLVPYLFMQPFIHWLRARSQLDCGPEVGPIGRAQIAHRAAAEINKTANQTRTLLLKAAEKNALAMQIRILKLTKLCLFTFFLGEWPCRRR